MTTANRCGPRSKRLLAAFVSFGLLAGACGGSATDSAKSDSAAGRASGTSARGRTSSTTTPPPPFTPDPVTWQRCASTDGDDPPGTYECGSVAVPIDYSQPAGPKQSIAMKRRLADDRGARIGTLFIEPGGPGASGVDAVGGFVDAVTPDVPKRFDILGFDPRGIGKSGRLPCGDGILAYFAIDLTKPSPTETINAGAKAWADECAKSPLAAYVGTINVARDMESIRIAVGDPKLNYLGISYGSEIGLAYAELHPTTIRAMIIDGIVDFHRSSRSVISVQTEDWSKNINSFLDWCDDPKRNCAFGPDSRARLKRLEDKLSAAPITYTADGKTIVVGPTLVLMAILNVGDRKKNLAEHLVDAENGDVSWFATTGIGATETFSAGVFMQCADFPLPRGDAYQKFVESENANDALVGALGANWNRPCAYWAVPSDRVPRDYRAEGSPPIMVWGNTGDTTTPYQDAVDASQQLENGHLVTLDADQHVAMATNDCVRRIQGAYLLDLQLPPDDTHC